MVFLHDINNPRIENMCIYIDLYNTYQHMLFFIEYVFMYSKLSQLSVHLEPNMIRSVNPFQHT